MLYISIICDFQYPLSYEPSLALLPYTYLYVIIFKLFNFWVGKNQGDAIAPMPPVPTAMKKEHLHSFNCSQNSACEVLFIGSLWKIRWKLFILREGHLQCELQADDPLSCYSNASNQFHVHMNNVWINYTSLRRLYISFYLLKINKCRKLLPGLRLWNRLSFCRISTAHNPHLHLSRYGY